MGKHELQWEAWKFASRRKLETIDSGYTRDQTGDVNSRGCTEI